MPGQEDADGQDGQQEILAEPHAFEHFPQQGVYAVADAGRP